MSRGFYYFMEWYHDKVAQVHQRMRYFQARGVYPDVVIQEYVYVYGAVVINPAFAFRRPAETPLDILRGIEHFKWRQPGMHAHGSIDKTVGR